MAASKNILGTSPSRPRPCAGGTHHDALVLGDRAEAIAAFGRMCGLEAVSL